MRKCLIHKTYLDQEIGVGKARIIILGNSGFIGGTLERSLKESYGKTAVIGFSSATCDLRNPRSTKKLKRYFTPNTIVIVCASLQKRLGDTPDLFAGNVAMAVNLCNVFKEAPVKRVIFFSTAGVYGEDIDRGRITESTPPCPTSFYALSKVTSERLLSKTLKDLGIPILIIRPPFIYGLGEQNNYGPYFFLDMALKRKPIRIWGNGSELREFVFIEDLVKITKLLIRSRIEGVLNVVSGKGYAFRDSIRIIRKLLRREVKVVSLKRTRKKVNSLFKRSRIDEIAPSFKFTSLEKGMEEMLKALRKRDA